MVWFNKVSVINNQHRIKYFVILRTDLVWFYKLTVNSQYRILVETCQTKLLRPMAVVVNFLVIKRYSNILAENDRELDT